jgi:hypothetical protein
LKLGIGKFVSMGSVSFNSLTSTIDKPDCTQGSITGTAKIILIIHGITPCIALDPSSDKNCESDNGRGIELALVSSSGAAKIVDPGYWAAM